MNERTKTFPHVRKYGVVIKNNKKWLVQRIEKGIGKICSYEEPPELDGATIDLEEPYKILLLTSNEHKSLKSNKIHFSYKEVTALIKDAYIEGGKSALNFERNFDLEEWISKKLKK